MHSYTPYKEMGRLYRESRFALHATEDLYNYNQWITTTTATLQVAQADMWQQGANITYTDASGNSTSEPILSVNVPTAPQITVPFSIQKSLDGKRLIFNAPDSSSNPSIAIMLGYKPVRKSGKIVSTQMGTNHATNLAMDPFIQSLVVSKKLIFSLATGKLNIYAVEVYSNSFIDITYDFYALSEILKMSLLPTNSVFTSSSAIDGLKNSALEIIINELISMGTSLGMKVSYLKKPAGGYNMINALNHLSSPLLVQTQNSDVSPCDPLGIMNPEDVPILRRKNFREAIKKVYGKDNPALMKILYKFLERFAYKPPVPVENNLVWGTGTGSTYTVPGNGIYQITGTVVASSSNGYGYGNNTPPITMDIGAFYCIKVAEDLFETLDYQMKYVEFFLLKNSIYSPYYGVRSSHGLNLPFINQVMCGFPDIKKFRLLTESDNQPYDAPWFNLNLIGDTRNQYDNYKNADSIPKILKDKFPNGLEIPEKWETIKELHDKISVNFRTIKAEAEAKDVPFNEEWLDFEGVQILDTILVLAKRTNQLVEWGQKLNNCIASYSDRAVDKKVVLFALYKDGEPLMAGELKPSNYDIVQLMMNRNQRAPDEYWKAVNKIWDAIYSIEKTAPYIPEETGIGIINGLAGNAFIANGAGIQLNNGGVVNGFINGNAAQIQLGGVDNAAAYNYANVAPGA